MGTSSARRTAAGSEYKLNDLCQKDLDAQCEFFLKSFIFALGDAWNKVFFGQQKVFAGALMISVFYGALLASASKDNVVVVWDVTQPSVPKLSELRGHEASLAFVAWAPSGDDSLLTCANDHLITLWRVRTAECLRTYARHGGAVTACAWANRLLEVLDALLDAKDAELVRPLAHHLAEYDRSNEKVFSALRDIAAMRRLSPPERGQRAAELYEVLNDEMVPTSFQVGTVSSCRANTLA